MTESNVIARRQMNDGTWILVAKSTVRPGKFTVYEVTDDNGSLLFARYLEHETVDSAVWHFIQCKNGWVWSTEGGVPLAHYTTQY